jgi:hypothetical protein
MPVRQTPKTTTQRKKIPGGLEISIMDDGRFVTLSVNLKQMTSRLISFQNYLNSRERPVDLVCIQETPLALAYADIPAYDRWYRVEGDEELTEEDAPTDAGFRKKYYAPYHTRDQARATTDWKAANAEGVHNRKHKKGKNRRKAQDENDQGQGEDRNSKGPVVEDPPRSTSEEGGAPDVQKKTADEEGMAKTRSEGKKLAKVAFLVHRTVPSKWWVEEAADKNTGLLATLMVQLTDRTLAFHNLYNHLKRADLEAVVKHIEYRAKPTVCHVFTADINLKNRAWSGDDVEAQGEGQSDLLVEGLSRLGLICINERGQVTYTKSTQELYEQGKTQGSVLDIVFQDQCLEVDLTDTLTVHNDIKGFESDHRIVEFAVEIGNVVRPVQKRYVWEFAPRLEFNEAVESQLKAMFGPAEKLVAELEDEAAATDMHNKILEEILMPSIERFIPVQICFEPRPKRNKKNKKSASAADPASTGEQSTATAPTSQPTVPQPMTSQSAVNSTTTPHATTTPQPTITEPSMTQPSTSQQAGSLVGTPQAATRATSEPQNEAAASPPVGKLVAPQSEAELAAHKELRTKKIAAPFKMAIGNQQGFLKMTGAKMRGTLPKTMLQSGPWKSQVEGAPPILAPSEKVEAWLTSVYKDSWVPVHKTTSALVSITC